MAAQSLSPDSLTKLRDRCVYSARFSIPSLELMIVPIAIPPDDVFLKSFLKVAKDHLKDRYATKADVRTWLCRSYPLLYNYHLPGRSAKSSGVRAHSGRIPPDKTLWWNALVKCPNQSLPLEFGVCLRNWSLVVQSDGCGGKPTEEEEEYLAFTKSAGTVLIAEGVIDAADPVVAWMSFLVGHIWRTQPPKVSRGYAILTELWTRSLEALNAVSPVHDAAPANSEGSIPSLKQQALQLASKHLGGTRRLLVERVCKSNEPVPLADLVADAAFQWNMQTVDGSYNKAQSGANKVLRRLNVRLRRHDRAVYLASLTSEKLSREGTVEGPKEDLSRG